MFRPDAKTRGPRIVPAKTRPAHVRAILESNLPAVPVRLPWWSWAAFWQLPHLHLPSCRSLGCGRGILTCVKELHYKVRITHQMRDNRTNRRKLMTAAGSHTSSPGEERVGIGACPIPHMSSDERSPTGCPISHNAAEFDPFRGDYQMDPVEALRWAREQEPVFYSPKLGYWVVTRYNDVKAIFRDNILFRRRSRSKR